MPEAILVFHLGQLGDTLIALPAFCAVRRHFPGVPLTLLGDRHVGKSYVLAADLLRSTGLFEAFAGYPVDQSPRGRWLRPWRMLQLLARLRAQRYDTLVYLAPSTRRPDQVRRDRQFFAAAGIRQFIGLNGFPNFHFTPIPKPRLAKPRNPNPHFNSPSPISDTSPARRLPSVPHETDLLLARLAASGINVPPPGKARMDLNLRSADEAPVNKWLAHLPSDGGRPWIGIGPGSKMPAKRWPVERFQEVVAGLIQEFDVWPVVFGGPEDHRLGEEMIQSWRRGYNAAGQLSLRAAASALTQCQLYVGNDTGTMHLAVAAGVRCVALFSARDWPGHWYPYGAGHRVFRATVDCEGCGLQTCAARHNECLRRIQVSEVHTACAALLATQRQLCAA